MAKKPTEKRVTQPAKPKPAANKAVAKKPTAKKPKVAAKTAADPARVYTLDVWLTDGPMTRAFLKKNKSVGRTIQVKGHQTLERLHECIFDAFGRDDPHMYEFQMGTGPMDPEGPRYVLPMAADDDFGPPILGTVDETTLDQMGLTEGRQFGYWFDFGDDWHHQIDVVKVEDGPGSGAYPRVVKRVGASPPQYVDEGEEG